jgi:hypothetical protein
MVAVPRDIDFGQGGRRGRHTGRDSFGSKRRKILTPLFSLLSHPKGGGEI